MYMLHGRRAIFQGDVIDGYILITGGIELTLVEDDPSPSIDGSAEEDRTQCCDEIRETLEFRLALGLRWLGRGLFT